MSILPEKNRASFKRKSLHAASHLAVAAFALGMAQAAAAQEAGAASSNDSAIQEIVVTAQRRAESIQKVPIAIEAFSNQQFAKLGIADTKDLQAKVPALTISIAGPQLYFLRGVGTSASSVQAEQSVASYIDGVYLYASWGNTVPTSSLQRVEVLKGPQGTLFGRNTTGGVIQMVTRDPMDGTSFQGHLGYANYKTITGDAYAALKLSDQAAISASVDYRHQGDGWGYDFASNTETYKRNNLSLQLKGVLQPTETTKVTGFFWYNRLRSTGYQTQPVLAVVDRYESLADTSNLEHTTSYLGYGRVDQELGDVANLVSITSYRKVKSQFNYDYDSSSLPIIDSHLTQPTHNFQQEFQLVSPSSSKVQWLLGAYYFAGQAEYDPISLRGLGLAPLTRLDSFNKQKVRSKSGFGQITVPITDDTRLTGGFRYTWEKTRHLPGFSTLGTGAPIITTPEQKIDSNGPTWRITLDHQFSSSVMGYVSYNRGLKSGGFSLANSTNLPGYKPEKLDAYEVGFKTELLDRKLRLNVAAFLYKFNDIQVLESVGTTIITTNAAKATLKGVDGDFTAQLTPNLSLYGSAGYLDAHYGDYAGALGYNLNGSTFTFDASGQRTVFSPKLTASIGSTVTVPVSFGKFVLNGYVQHLSKQYVGPANILALPAHTQANAQLTWTDADDRLSLQFWANNLFDKKYLDSGLETLFGAFVVPGAPRTYGVKAGYKF